MSLAVNNPKMSGTDTIKAEEHHQKRLRQMDVFIAGVGRSGTTLLAILLTRPPERWIMVEPGLTRQDMGEHMRRQAERFGIQISVDEWRGKRPEESAMERFQRVLLPRLENVRWGVKEVNMAGTGELMNLFLPSAVLLCVRNIRDCAVSLYEKNQRAGHNGQKADWLIDRLITASQTLVRLKRSMDRGALRVARYEDFVSDPAERLRLAQWLDWPLDGDPAWCMEIYGRQEESARHAGKLGNASVNRGSRTSDPASFAFAQKVIRQAEEYQAEFGYDYEPL